MTSGKPLVSLGFFNVFDVLRQIAAACPKTHTLAQLVATR